VAAVQGHCEHGVAAALLERSTAHAPAAPPAAPPAAHAPAAPPARTARGCQRRGGSGPLELLLLAAEVRQKWLEKGKGEVQPSNARECAVFTLRLA
jgi:hypothetical protein